MSGMDRVTWEHWTDLYGVQRPRLVVLSPTAQLLRDVNVRDSRKAMTAITTNLTRSRGDYQTIADAWRYFNTVGFTPTRDVSQIYGVPYSTAAQWVTRARQMGLLEPVSRLEASA
jgi:hypothetical protein